MAIFHQSDEQFQAESLKQLFLDYKQRECLSPQHMEGNVQFAPQHSTVRSVPGHVRLDTLHPPGLLTCTDYAESAKDGIILVFSKINGK